MVEKRKYILGDANECLNFQKEAKLKQENEELSSMVEKLENVNIFIQLLLA